MLKKSQKNITTNKKENNNKVLTKSLESNIALFESIFSSDEALIIRRFQNKHLATAKCCVLYFDEMVNTELLNEDIIQPILSNNLKEEISSDNLLEELQYKVISSNNVKISVDINEMVDAVIYGDTIFLLDGYEKTLIINAKGWKTRAISEPASARVVRGPREGFTESIMVSISLLRRKIKSPDLKFKFREIGERTRTKVAICYIEGVARDEILKELELRLSKIKIDAVLDSGYIQELIRDEPFSPFETVGYSERPDVIASKLLEGRIALLVDGSPFVLTVPFVLIEGYQANEDYYSHFILSSFNRLIRATSAFVAIGIPAIYVALVTYHQEMLPTPLLLSIAASRQGVPLPTSISFILMLLTFDALREASTRMPTTIGQAVNIVGALVLGQAAVEARLVSAPVVIITALSGIMTLLSASNISAVIVLRFFLLVAASIMGIYGYIFGMIAAFIHLMNMRSFGVPYMLGLSRAKNHDGQDIWIRAPWWTMTVRPKIIGAKNLTRQSVKKSRGK